MKDPFSVRVIRNIIYYSWIYPFSFIKKHTTTSFNQNIYIFGISRGGSTILLESLNVGLPKSTKLWEPIAGGFIKIKKLRKWNFTTLPIIPENNKNTELLSSFDSILRGGHLNLSMTYVNDSLVSIPLNKHLIFKFCRGNNLLPWLVNNFDINSILLLRGPYQTINSQINHGAYKHLMHDPSFNIPKTTPFLEEYKKFKEVIDQCKTPEEHLAIKWSINMQIVKHHQHNKKWLTIFYEDLINQPEVEFKRIKEYTSLPIDIKKSVGRLNSTSSSGSTGGKSRLSKKQLKNIDEILKKMNLLEFTRKHF